MDSAFYISDDLLGDVDEPPDESENTPRPAASHRNTPDFTKSCNQNAQKASLLTQALHASEDDYDDEDEDEEDELVMGASGMKRGPSTSSTWSHTSGASTAELTSDGGLTSPGTRTNSPSPPPPSNLNNLPPFLDKPFDGDVHVRRANGEKINLAQKTVIPTTENTLEAGLGRKRCITFACGRKDSSDTQPVAASKPAEAKPTEAPKRPCMLKFICPSKVSNEPKPPVSPKPRRGRLLSPPPPSKRQKTPSGQNRQHRDSDSTVRNESPRSYRKSTPLFRPRQSSRTSDLGKETKFQDYTTSGDDFDEWAEESTAYRRRITVNDTLAKENGLRKLGEEIEEEALEEEEELEEEENQDDEDEDEDDQDEAGNQDEESDDGFRTDDEDGFAVSDDESDAGSEAEWWAPSTSKTIEHIRPTGQRTYSISSIGSVGSPPSVLGAHHQRRTKPVKIRSQAPDLPDSTDFVCGTLDEDRPLEEAYIQNIEKQRALKHKVTPQDIDPTFPQSDPEMDEEDEDDEVVGSRTEESDHHQFMHGRPDWHDEGSVRGRPQFKNPFQQSPRLSPKRLHSPPPLSRRSTLANRSPPPPRRKTSPAPFRRLFGGQSPRRLRSPPPFGRLRSPPPTRRTSYAMSPPSKIARHPVLAARTHAVTHTSSLPRPPSGFPLQMMAEAAARNEAAEQETDDCGCVTAKQHRNRLRTRGAIDIVKGLEKKRALRKEKIFAKQCRKHPRGEKKPLMPGRGAERMQKIGMGRYNAKKGVPEPIWGGGREEFVLSL